MTERVKKFEIWGILLSLAGFFVLFRSYSTSFLFPDIYGNDSAQFQVIGRMWSEGKLPYVDCFDHKGPVIFLIDMIGYKITGNSIGIMILQIVFMFFTLLALYDICKDNKYWFIIIIASVFTIAFNYAEGNLTGEYCLPFLSYSMYLQLKYITGESEEHNPWSAFFYGISFAVCLLTRLSNAVPVAAGVVVITFFLIKKKKWKNLLHNMFAFFAGIILLLCPFIIYFGIKGQLYELYFGTIGFNLLYQKRMESWITGADMYTWTQFAIVYIAYFSLFISVILASALHKYRLVVYCVVLALAESWLFLSGAGFSQYGIIAIPNITLFWVLLLDFGAKHSKLVQRLSVLCLCGYVLFTGGRMINRIVENMTVKEDSSIEEVDGLMEYIPEEDRDCFIAYGDDTLKAVYLKYHIDPCYPYFAIQEWHASFSNAVRESIHQTFQSEKAKWILTGETTNGIQDILDAHYELVAKTNGYRLYHHVSSTIQ